MSFKAGEAEGVRDGRFFKDYTEGQLRELIGGQRLLTVLRTWTTEDVRPNRQGEYWINALIKRDTS
jgi:hypothetical protein